MLSRIEIWSAVTAHVFLEGLTEIGGNYRASLIRLERDGHFASLSVAEDVLLDIDSRLLNLVGDNATLKSGAQLQADVIAAYGALRARLKNIRLIRSTSSTFFGLPTTASVDATLSIGLPAAGDPPSLSVTGRLGFDALVRRGAVSAQTRLSIGFSWDGNMPTVAIDLPLMGIGFRFPAINFPNLALPDVTWPLDLAGWGLNAVVRWTAPPELKIKINGSSVELLIQAVGGPDAPPFTPAAGILAIGGTDLLQISDLTMSGPLDALDYTITLVGLAALRTSIPPLAAPVGPFTISWDQALSGISYAFSTAGSGSLTATTNFEALNIAWGTGNVDSIELNLTLVTIYHFSNGDVTTTQTRFEITNVDASALVPKLLEGAAGLRRLVLGVRLEKKIAGVEDLIARLASLAQALAGWLAGGVSAAGNALAGLARGAFDVIAAIGKRLLDLLELASAASDYLVIELRWDRHQGRLRQILITPLSTTADPREFGGGELQVSLPATRWAILADLDEHWVALAQIAGTPVNINLETDLWLESASGSTPVRDAEARKRLISTSLAWEASTALLVLERKKVEFFRTLVAGGDSDTVQFGSHRLISVGEPYRLGNLKPPTFTKFQIDTDRLSSLFPVPAHSGDSSILSSVEVVSCVLVDLPLEQAVKELKLELRIKLGGESITTDLLCRLYLADFSAKFDALEIALPEEQIELLGGSAKIAKNAAGKGLVLNLSDAPSFGLAKGASATLAYKKLSSDDGSLDFLVPQFSISSTGLDLEARVVPKPIRLPGLDTVFKFTDGAIRIERNRLLSASIAGSGELPRALLGEARLSAAIQFGTDGPGQDFKVIGATARLEKTGEPLVCESTRFRFELSHVGLNFKEIDGKTHFYGELTGNAKFRPNVGEFDNGMLAHFPELTIMLDRAPIAGDGRTLAKSISFLVPIDPPAKGTFFNIFEYSVRSVALLPAYAGWSDEPPAIAIGGQAMMTKAFDTINPRIDAHAIYFAGPAKGQSLPRVRFDGLGIGLRIGSMAELEATAVAVDGKLPTLFAPDALPADVTAQGYLASGRLRISGWAPMSASAGFLELEKDGTRRHAFFAYAQQEQLSEAIPTPVGTLYLREVGFGLGFRYTLEALQATDKAEDPRALISLLDPISRRQGDLHKFTAWLPEPEGNRLTLAMRAMFSVASASTSSNYNAKKEKDLANPVLFDVVAALRSDLTFLLSARAWIAVNYADWIESGASFSDKPLLRGYIYISAPKRTFLGRFLSDPEGHVGEHPKLPDPLVTALRAVRFSSTIYIRPGLFHQEYGWPYELEVKFPKKNGFSAQINGGMVLRIEDGAVLQGIAFRGSGTLDLEGSVGGSVGASIRAHALISIEGKFLAYVSVARPADSLFYGRLALAIALDISISFWVNLRFVSMSASWQEAINLEIDLEVAMGPGDGIGIHARASVSVRRFGRGLRVGISVGYNRDMLATARARVDRFMALGLGATVPDPASTLGPVSEAARSDRTITGDSAVLSGAERVDRTPVLPEPDADRPTPIPTAAALPGVAIAACDFWAILMPMGEAGALLQLMPRDGADSYGGFFVAPDGGYELVANNANVSELLQMTWLNPLQGRTPNPLVTLTPNWDAQLDAATGDQPPRLRDLVAGAFMGLDPEKKLTQPPGPNDPAPAVDAAQWRADAQGALEARGAILGHIGDLALRHAALRARPPEPLTADLLGLTFDLDPARTGISLEEALEILFPDVSALRQAAFSLRKSDAAAGPAGAVALFNPPERMFANANPQLAEARAWIDRAGIKLDWDLEPLWRSSRHDVFDDPEYHLHHYRVSRTIVVGTDRIGGRTWAAKRAALCDEAGERPKGDLPSFQVLDDLSDLTPELKAVLLANKDRITDGLEAERLYLSWRDRFQAKEVRLVYTVVPTDNAGTANQLIPSSIVLMIDPPPKPKPASFQFANLRFSYLSKRPADTDAMLRRETKPELRFIFARTRETSEWTDTAFEVAIESGRDQPRSGFYGADPTEPDWNATLDKSDIDALPRIKFDPSIVAPGAIDRAWARFEDQDICWQVDINPQLWVELGIVASSTLVSARLYARLIIPRSAVEADWTPCDLELRLKHHKLAPALKKTKPQC